MALMVPPTIPISCKSPGEREIFNSFKEDTSTKGWIVLHSLDVMHHTNQISGEADFVIIVPKLGVLCLEVKACHSLRRENGLWYYGTNQVGDSRGPFKQAAEAMHSLRQRVAQKSPTLRSIPFWSAVAFPYIEFTTDSDEWHSWQILDVKKFDQQSISLMVIEVLQHAREFLSKQQRVKWFRKSEDLPRSSQVGSIAKILRSNFEYWERPADRRTRKAAEILHYTEEQFNALDLLEGNERILFSGPAGIGKTVLAIEAARRASNEGRRVLFLCFNRLLGQWLSSHSIVQSSLVTIMTFHQYLKSIVDTQQIPNIDDVYWKTLLPNAAIEKLLHSHPQESHYDMLIIDEFQDLLEPLYLDVLDLVLDGGIRSGQWRFLGDFEHQILYGQTPGVVHDILENRLTQYARCSLRINCRNTPRIATCSELLGKIKPSYSRILRPDDNVEPSINYYATPSQQRKRLSMILDELLKDSFSNEDIVILSSKGRNQCVASKLTENRWDSTLAPYESTKPHQIRYTSIHSYKGLDAPVIIITDIEYLNSEHFSALLYVGTTRALERLFLIVHVTVKPEIIKSLVKAE